MTHTATYPKFALWDPSACSGCGSLMPTDLHWFKDSQRSQLQNDVAASTYQYVLSSVPWELSVGGSLGGPARALRNRGVARSTGVNHLQSVHVAFSRLPAEMHPSLPLVAYRYCWNATILRFHPLPSFEPAKLGRQRMSASLASHFFLFSEICLHFQHIVHPLWPTPPVSPSKMAAQPRPPLNKGFYTLVRALRNAGSKFPNRSC